MAGVTFETLGVLHSQRALILLRRGETAEALDAFGLGISMLTDPVELGKAHINRGNLHLARGAGHHAAEDFATAVTLLQRSGNELEAAMAEHNLGYADLLSGDLVSALHHMDAVRPVLLPLSQVGAAICNQDRAEVLMAAGLTRRGLAALDEAARTYGQHRMPHRRGEAELIIARATLADDPSRALAAARAARARFARMDAPALRLKAEALVHGAEVRLGRTGPSLVRRARALTAELEALALRWWALDIELDAALVSMRRGELDDARHRLASIRVPARAPLGVRLRERDVRAALAERAGRRADALRHDGDRARSSPGRPRDPGSGGVGIARSPLRVVRARADAGQPGPAGAGARRRARPGRPPGAARAGHRRGHVARRCGSSGRAAAAGPGACLAEPGVG
jgi:tetratricopeptide (TPR) repeat protein